MKFKTPTEGALCAARNGMLVFPVAPNKKYPRHEGWQTWATLDADKILAYAKKHPNTNWGIHCTGMIVVDLDKKDGVSGANTFRDLIKEHGLIPKTLVVRTPSGGQHLYFSGPDVPNKVRLGPGLDIRSKGGLVVCFGSRQGKNAYEVTSWPTPLLAPAPQWLINHIRDKTGNRQGPIIDETGEIPDGVRNDTLFRFACQMRYGGAPVSVIRAALETLNTEHTNPPVTTYALDGIINRAGKYAPTVAMLMRDFGIPPEDETLIPIEELGVGKSKARDWLMVDRFIPGYLSLIVSTGGVGKSIFFLLDALSVATGNPYSGFEVKQPGRVWVLNTEDPLDEIHRRIDALCQLHKIKEEEIAGKLFVSSGQENPIVLAEEIKDKFVINQPMIEHVVSCIRRYKISLWLIDPAIRIHRVNENSNRSMDQVAQILQGIMSRTGCTIGLAHHTSKAGAATRFAAGDQDLSRGASSFVNAARIVHLLATMSTKEAEKHNVEDKTRWRFVQLVVAKANLTAPQNTSHWLEKHSVLLPNEDTVGALKTVELASPIETDADKARVLAEILDEKMQIGDVVRVGEAISLFLKNSFAARFFPSNPATWNTIVLNLFDLKPSIGNKIFYAIRKTGRGFPHRICIRDTLTEEETPQTPPDTTPLPIESYVTFPKNHENETKNPTSPAISPLSPESYITSPDNLK